MKFLKITYIVCAFWINSQFICKLNAQDVNYAVFDKYKYNLHLFGVGYVDSLFKLPTMYQIDFSVANLNSLNQNSKLFSKDNQITLNYNQHFVLLKKNRIIFSNQTSFNTTFTNNEQFSSYVFSINFKFIAGLYYQKFFIATPVQLVNYLPHYVDFKSNFFRELHGAKNNGWQKSPSSRFKYGLLLGITPTSRWDIIFEIQRYFETSSTRTNSSFNEYKLQLNYRIKLLNRL